jgi:hypothetical protein
VLLVTFWVTKVNMLEDFNPEKEAMMRFTSCSSKKRYDTEKGATKRLKKYSTKFKKNGRVYFCEYCCGFHITTKRI